MKKKILYVYEKRIPLQLRSLIKKKILGYGFSFNQMNYQTSSSLQKKHFSSADAVLFAPARFITTDIMTKAKKAKIFQIWSSGYDKFNLGGALKLNIPICNNGSQNSIAVAEHAILLMLSCARKLIHFYERTVNGNWKNNSHGLDLIEIKNKTVGIIGFGKIGKRVAQLLSGFNVKIIYYDKIKLRKKDEKKFNAQYKSINYLVKNSDIITLHLHLNKKTKFIINESSLKLMKKNPILINVSRAELIEQKSLIKALKNKKISGFGIDAHYIEPTKKNDKLLNLENVISTPHIAGSTYDTYLRVVEACLNNIKCAFNNKQKIKWKIN
ncbi:hypothetical protein IDH26_05695 [Pelagibacterales bacterium SAG-MED50]|nr:hypothetical protein [Pelagibacterales bacterium SAG-MED50]